MYGYVRVFAGGIVLLSGLYVSQKYLRRKKAFRIVLFIIIAAGFILSYFVPVENVFYSFPSPQEAFQYIQGEENDIQIVLNGEQSSMIIARAADDAYSDMVAISPKVNGKWKIPMWWNLSTTKMHQVANGVIVLQQYRDTDDFYIHVSLLRESPPHLSDSLDTKFVLRKDETASPPYCVYHYYAYLRRSKDYHVNMDGKNVWVSFDRW